MTIIFVLAFFGIFNVGNPSVSAGGGYLCDGGATSSTCNTTQGYLLSSPNVTRLIAR